MQCEAYTLRHINKYTERTSDVTVCCALWWQFNKLPTNYLRSYCFAIHLKTLSTRSIITERMWLQRYKIWLQTIKNMTINAAQCDYKGYTIWLQTIHKVTQNTDLNKTFLTFKMLYDFTVHSLKKIHLRPQENYGLPCTDFHRNHKWWKQFLVLTGADPLYYSWR
jgi:hypothetical protein